MAITYTVLGSTGFAVSRLGLGLAALGRPGYINLGHADDLAHDYDQRQMEARTHSVLDAAFAAGVTYFDTARSYGRGEEFLASWAQTRFGKSYPVVGSKWGYTYTANWNVHADHHEIKDHSLPVLRRQWAESREILGPRLGLYQIHSATLESGVLDNAEVLAELATIKGQGVAIGLTVSGPRQSETIRRAIATAVAGVRLFDTVQATWNLLERSAEPALVEAHAAGVGIIIKEGLANGRLTVRNTDQSLISRLRHVSQGVGVPIDALALAAILARPWVHVVLSGAATPEHLQSNLLAADVKWSDRLEEETLPLAEPPDEYWAKRGRLAWN